MTLNPEPVTLNPQPVTLNLQPLTLTLTLKPNFLEQVAHELGLPPCVIEDRVLTFSPPEASFYRHMHDEFAAALRRIDRLEIGRKAREERRPGRTRCVQPRERG